MNNFIFNIPTSTSNRKCGGRESLNAPGSAEKSAFFSNLSLSLMYPEYPASLYLF